MKKILPQLLSCLLLLSPLAGLQAAIFEDTFDYGTLNKDDTAVTSSQGAWYHAKFGNASTTQGISGNAMTVNDISTSGDASVYGYFQNSGNTHTVGVGESITLQIDMSYTGTPGSSFVPYTPIRFGMYNSNGNRETADLAGGAATSNFNTWTGYSSTWTIGTVDPNAGYSANQNRPGGDFYRRNGVANGLWNWNINNNGAHEEDNAVSLSDTYTNIGTNPDAGTNGSILLTLTLSRTGATTMDVTSTFFDGTNTYTTLTGTHTGAESSFDSIAFLVDNGNSSITDVSVNSISIIPEPSTLLLGLTAIGAAAFLRRRR